jgi:hypothetical protein
MKAMRERRRSSAMREVRLSLPDARTDLVRRRIAAQVANLDGKSERDSLDWIESVSEFDHDASR